MSFPQGPQGVFLNGKAQIVEMLRVMPLDERKKLLTNVSKRNPQLAEELIEECLDFATLERLLDSEITLTFEYIKAPIFGVALKNASVALQRRVLGLAPRNYAEEAYRLMTTPLANEQADVRRAQDKVVNVLVGLVKRRHIKI
jgi:flagellar motor switch protein FliG